MTGRRPRLRDSDSWRFDVSALALGTIVASVVTYRVARDAPGATLALAVAAGVPVIAFISRFPITLSHAGGRGLEVSFDSSVLVFLLCTVGTLEAVAVWSLGVAVTEAGSGKRPSARAFNVGLGVMAGGIAATVLHLLGGGGRGTPSEVAAVALAVASFFATDYLLTAVSLSLDSHTSLRRNLAQAGTWLAGGSFLGLTCWATWVRWSCASRRGGR